MDPVTISRKRLRLLLFALGVLCFGAPLNPKSALSESQFHTDGNAFRVSVWGAGDEATAEPFAERHCESYGKAARYLKMTPNRVGHYTYINSFLFECTAKGEKIRQ